MEEIATQLGEELIDSILRNDPTPIIKSLVETGAPVWYQNEAEGISSLHAAAYSRNLELVEYLIEKGAIWNAGAHPTSYIVFAHPEGQSTSGLFTKYRWRYCPLLQ